MQVKRLAIPGFFNREKTDKDLEIYSTGDIVKIGETVKNIIRPKEHSYLTQIDRIRTEQNGQKKDLQIVHVFRAFQQMNNMGKIVETVDDVPLYNVLVDLDPSIPMYIPTEGNDANAESGNDNREGRLPTLPRSS